MSRNKLHDIRIALKGFALVEISVVAIIIGVMVAVAIPALRSYDLRLKAHAPASAVDQAIAKLKWEQMAFEVPVEMELGSTGSVELIVGGGKSQAQLRDILQQGGSKDGERVQVSDRMDARLSGTGFKIDAITPSEQVVGQSDTTRWIWEIKPTEIGRAPLSLSLNALISIAGKEGQKSVQTFRKEVNVRVTTAGGAWAFIDFYKAYIGGIFSVVLIPVFVHFYNRRNGAPPP